MMKQVGLLTALLFSVLCSYVSAQDSTAGITVVTLEDVSVIDYRNDNRDIFKIIPLDTHSKENTLGGDLGDLISNSFPVYFKSYGPGGIKTITLRGAGAERTRVYWNGVPLNSPTLGGFDFSLLPLYFIEDAQLRLGGASLVDGAGGLGGSVQLTNPINIDDNSLEADIGYGSFDSYTVATKGRFIKRGFKSDTRVIWNAARNDFPFVNNFKQGRPVERREHNEFKQWGLQQLINWNSGKKNLFTAGFTLTGIGRNIPPSPASVSGGAEQDDRLMIGRLAWNRVWKTSGWFKIRTAYQNQYNRYFKEGVIDAETIVNAWNNLVDAGYEGFKGLRINGSIRFDRYWVVSDGAGHVKENRFSALAGAAWRVSKHWKLAGGLRINAISGSSMPVMPYGGISWELPGKMGGLRADFSRVYRFPTINDRYWVPGGNPGLKPENGWNYEIGYRNEFRRGRFLIKTGITGYYSLISDWILWKPAADNPIIWEAMNVWKVRNRGVEFDFDATYGITDRTDLLLAAGYNWVDAVVKESGEENRAIDDKQLILTPAHQVRMVAGMALKNLKVTLQYCFTGKRYTDRNNQNYLAPYHLLDLVAGYTFIKPRISLNLHLKNLLNTQYQTVQAQPLPGFNFNLELIFKIL